MCVCVRALFRKCSKAKSLRVYVFVCVLCLCVFCVCVFRPWHPLQGSHIKLTICAFLAFLLAHS